VARHSGATHLQAHVTKVRSRVRLPPDVDPEDVILQAERSEFLSKTHLDELRPGSNVEASVPGQFGKLLEHIDVHRYFMGLDEERPIPYGEAAAHWHDHVYLPVVEVIRAQGILQDFPGRTEADLYLWLAEHRRELKDELGWVVDTAVAAEDLAEQLGRDNQPFLRRIGRMLMRAVTPPELAGGAPPGARRAERLFAGREEQLFRDVLVAVDGRDSGWRALEQVGLLSRLEPLRAHGLHVVAPERSDGDERFVREEFDKRFGTLGVAGELTMGTGDIAEEIAELAHWTDLVVLGLDIPPEKRPIARIGSGVRRIISRSPRPILFVPGRPSPLDRAVLAYDGSPNAEEALFVSAYAAERWGISLKVVTAQELSKPQPETLRGACLYLEEQGVEATAIAAKGGPAEAIMETVESAGANLIIMGGYRFGPVLELVLGSTVDRVLRESCVPVLVCR
jgi:nucleotide-binding universal stress UspA family protein